MGCAGDIYRYWIFLDGQGYGMEKVQDKNFKTKTTYTQVFASFKVIIWESHITSHHIASHDI